MDNETEAYVVLRTVLHALRDRLPTDEAVHLGSELPMLIRGFYYEGWKPSATPKKQRSLEAFIGGMQPLPWLKGELEAEQALCSVFLMLDHRIREDGCCPDCATRVDGLGMSGPPTANEV